MKLELKVKVIDVLRLHCRAVDSSHCKYDDGWDDVRVAKVVNDPAVNRDSVRYIRSELLGNLATAATGHVEKKQQGRGGSRDGSGRPPGAGTIATLLTEIQQLRIALVELHGIVKHEKELRLALQKRVGGIDRAISITEVQHDALCRELVKAFGDDRFSRFYAAVMIGRTGTPPARSDVQPKGAEEYGDLTN